MLPNNLTARETQMLEALKKARRWMWRTGTASAENFVDDMNSIDAIIAACEPKHITVAVKPKECKGRGSAMVSPGTHCPCTERCCFCGWEQAKHEAVSKARRWVVDFPYLTCDPLTAYDPCLTVHVIREVKPITREQIRSAMKSRGILGSLVMVEELLESLGIEVED